MSLELPEPEETEMNMTPMIDIVFQLIIFFLISLKFKEIDRRIDSTLPKDRGLVATSEKPPEFEKIKIKLFRKNPANEAEAFTRIRVDNTHTIDLPVGDYGKDGASATARLALVKPVFKRLEDIVRKKFADQQNSPEVVAEIAPMAPTGRYVPHGDIMRVLDIIHKVEIKQVMFEGTAPPKLGSEGGHMTGK